MQGVFNLGTALRAALALGAALSVSSGANAATTSLADQPLSTARSKIANIVLTPSVEFPTAISNAHPDIEFQPTKIYVGYFDPYKCYKYNNTPAASARYFTPVAYVANKAQPQCSNAWSGNLLNYATMQTIDIFRWSMTGGSRWVEGSVNYDKPYDSADTSPSLVVLRRAYHNSQGSSSNFYVKLLRSSVAGGISAYVDSSSLSSLVMTNTLGFNSRTLGSAFRVANTTDRDPTKFPNTYVEFNAAAEVCKYNSALADNGLESNCKMYKSLAGQVAYKPEGLMQQYKSDFRFSVFGYYNRSYQTGSSGPPKDGAPMRAPMKFVDVELTDMGAYITNPDATVATASGVTNSGAMNYLNKFGFQSQTYKHYDNVSEMYAEALRYLRGEAAPSATTQLSSPTLSELDHFPAVNDWTSWPAIKNWCDQNFIVGIGDVNTHADRHILSGPSSGQEPNSAAINAGADAVAWTNAVGAQEGMGSLGAEINIKGDGTGYDFNLSKAINPGGCCTDNGFYMAGLAFYANTNDVNPTVPKTQTVQTYWVDILEYGIYKHRNQYWLAAKYGGFLDTKATPNGTGGGLVNKNGDTPDQKSEWWVNCRDLLSSGTCASPGSYPLPDNYYVAADAAQMVSSLSAAFSNIKASVSASAGSTGTSNVFQNYGSTDLIKTQYDTSDWSGDVIKYSVSGFDATSGAANTTTVWNARTVLNSQFAGTGWDTGRKIVTMGLKAIVSGTEQYQPTPFRIANLAPSQLATLGSTTAARTDVLNYIRGDKTKEGAPYRKRTYLLGDIVGSLAVIVGKPSAAYSDGFNPGYGAFKTAKAGRPEMVYVGGNDGMMHALRSSDGKEVFAYIPRQAFEGPFVENVGVDETDGLAALANPARAHKYYVNATPVVRDVDFARSGNLNWKTAGAADWRTILVGGLGKGGKSFYAIDVTDPPSLSDSETTIAQKVLWEFTHPDLGYSYGEPLIIKTERWGWVVVFTSGYNNSTGVGTLFVVNPANGTLIATAQTTSGSALNPSGLTEATGFTGSFQEWIFKELYAGDLDGNVWRFDLPVNQAVSGPTTIAVSKIATLSDGVNPQPITAPPWADVADSGKRYVFVGTGKALDAADITGTSGVNAQRQTLYAIPDGDIDKPYTTSTRPTTGGAPYNRLSLSKKTMTDLANRTATCTPGGWYFDLPDGGASGNGTERIIRNMKGSNNNWLMVISDVPSSDPCDSSGWYSWLYVLNMDCAQTQLGTSAVPQARAGGSGQQILSANLANYKGVGVLIETNTGLSIQTPIREKTKPKVVNWRSIGQ